MTHEEAQALLEGYADNELALSEVLRVEAHLRECEACRLWLEQRRALSARIRSAPLRYSLPPELQHTIGLKAWAGRSGSRSRPWTQALAASVVTGLLGLWVGHSLLTQSPPGDDWVNAHVRSTLSARPVDVLSSSHHTVKPWLASRLPFSPPVPELNDQGDTLIGGRADYVERTPVAALRYQHGNHQIDVFVWPDSERPTPPASGATFEGFHVAVARVAGYNAVMVSDMSAGELDAFRERWRARAGLQ
jgi:anti-sigma factor RsiW